MTKIRWRDLGMETKILMRHKGILNGCGPKGGWLARLVPNSILGLRVEDDCEPMGLL